MQMVDMLEYIQNLSEVQLMNIISLDSCINFPNNCRELSAQISSPLIKL